MMASGEEAMAHGTYLVVAPEGALAALAAGIAAVIGTREGDPLVAAGPTRALVMPQVADALTAARPDVTLGEHLAILGARSVEPLSDSQVAALAAFRSGAEVSLPRATPAEMASGYYDWHLATTRLPQAWAEVRGAPGAIDWEGIRVGQIDTGHAEHPCLGPWVGRGEGRNFFAAELSGEPDPFIAANRDPLSALDPMSGPHAGHGTRTASVLAGFDEGGAARTLPVTGEPVRGYYGAAPKVPHVPVRLSNCVMIDNLVRELAEALEYLVEEARCAVITMSMGAAPAFRLPSRTRDMIDRAYERGVIVCCAAGNYVPFVVSPAASPRTIAVAGSAPGDRQWNGSSAGAHVDISAPGWPIRRADVTSRGPGGYAYGEGTSYATPQVAGTAALWLARHRGSLGRAYPEPWMKVAAFLRLLVQTARKRSGWDAANYGAGVLDAGAVLAAPLPAKETLERDDSPHFID
jgi:hypothetical protein